MISPKAEDSFTGSKTHKTSYAAEVLHFHHRERRTRCSKTPCSQHNSVLAKGMLGHDQQLMLIAQIYNHKWHWCEGRSTKDYTHYTAVAHNTGEIAEPRVFYCQTQKTVEREVARKETLMFQAYKKTKLVQQLMFSSQPNKNYVSILNIYFLKIIILFFLKDSLLPLTCDFLTIFSTTIFSYSSFVQLSVLKVKPCSSYTKKCYNYCIGTSCIRKASKVWCSRLFQNVVVVVVVVVVIIIMKVHPQCQQFFIFLMYSRTVTVMNLCEHYGIQYQLVSLTENVFQVKLTFTPYPSFAFGWFFLVSLMSFV